MKSRILKTSILIGLLLFTTLIIIMNDDVELETFYWPDASKGELFRYEHIAEVYYEHPKNYRIEIENKDGVLKQLRIIEELHILKGRKRMLMT